MVVCTHHEHVTPSVESSFTLFLHRDQGTDYSNHDARKYYSLAETRVATPKASALAVVSLQNLIFYSVVIQYYLVLLEYETTLCNLPR
jgi:hypothetical protein